ncbi:MAG: TonB-dependent receptor [Chromatiales bacterium]|nr:TonB-dependent receptor [Chromatiales bacterium]
MKQSNQNRRRHSPRYAPALLGAVLCVCTAAQADSLQRLKAMSLDQLANLDVSIVGKRPSNLSTTAAAVYVITEDDIRRSTATRLPELLRHVPGINFARIDSGEWAISSRGFNSRYANKLLVMIDGRSIYSPLFSGVFWEAQDLPLDNIERIEVIRGPGGATWGANAVNGVINIITKKAERTQGASAMLALGDEQRTGWVRYGAAVGDNTQYRIDAKLADRFPYTRADGTDDNDHWSSRRAGFRVDHQAGYDDTLTFQGGAYHEDADDPTYHGWHLLGEWTHVHDDGAQTVLHTSFERGVIEAISGGLLVGDGGGIGQEDLHTANMELRHQPLPIGAHDLSFGLGMRRSESEIDPLAILLKVEPMDRTSYLYSAFFQDEITLVPEKWKLVLGARAEHNDYTGFEFQPSVRLSWRLDADTNLWASVGRAVHTPARAERDIQFELLAGNQELPGFGTLPQAFRIGPNSRWDSEELIAYELGLRHLFTNWAKLDLAVFYNVYEELAALRIDTPQLIGLPPTGVLINGEQLNLGRARTFGLEASLDLRLREDWRLQLAYSYLNMNVDISDESNDEVFLGAAEGESPRNQLSLHSAHDLSDTTELDAWLYYVDDLPSQGVDAYTNLDLRLAHQVNRNLSLELVGRNLLDPHHFEWGTTLIGGDVQQVDREFFLKLRLDF